MSERRVRRLAAAGPVLGLAVLAGVLSCEEEEKSTPGGDLPGGEFCAEVTTRLRGCELLSEGEPNCGLFRSPEYVACFRPCFEAASCEDFRAQACDDVDNELALCLDRCLLEAATIDCGDGTRADVDEICDGTPDCASGADEQRCGDGEDEPFACGNGQSVSAGDQCDGTMDCSNGRDEAGCPMRAMTICPGGF